MAKRFTDTAKWNIPFIRGLKAPYKLLWLFIWDECDHAGIWQVDFQIAQIKTGEKFKPELAIQQLGEKIHVFDNGQKWFIPSFIELQYGNLNPEIRAHSSALSILKKYDLVDNENKIKPFTNPLQRGKDKDMDKDMDKDKDKDNSTVPKETDKAVIPLLDEFLAYVQLNYDGNFSEIEASAKLKYLAWVEAGWKDGFDKDIKNWKSKALNIIPHLKKEIKNGYRYEEPKNTLPYLD
jgi:hypothetical protein